MPVNYQIEYVVQRLAAADNRLGNGSVSYRYRTSGGTKAPKNVSATTVFTTDLFNMKRNDGRNIGRMVYDGQDSISIFGEGAAHPNVTISPGKFFFNAPQYAFQEVFPGPCFMEGRGLSQLNHLQIVSSNPNLIISATGPDGTTFEAELLPDQQFLAKSIVWRDSHGLLKHSWELDTPMKAVGGPIIAAHCVQYYRNRNYSEDSTITAANCYVPSNSEFQEPLVPGLHIIDMRLGQPVSANQNRPTTITKDQLLEMSKSYLVAEARRQDSSREESHSQANRRSAAGILPYLIALSFITTLVIWLKRRRRHD